MPGPRLRLVVLFGGQSAEHDVSCTTAAHVLRAVDPERYDVVAIGIDRAGQWVRADDANAALAAGAVPDRLVAAGSPMAAGAGLATGAAMVPTTTDRAPGRGVEPTGTVVLPLLHGPLGEDGTVQGLLELADLPYVGSGVLGSALCMDKAMAKTVLAAHGLPQVPYVALAEHELRPSTATTLAEQLGLPLFVKPANMGSSVGVSKARTVEEVRAAIDRALAYDSMIVAEQAAHGREIEVAILGNEHPRASVPGEIVPGNEFYDYEDKYVTDGAKLLIPAPLDAAETAEVTALALRAFAVLRCDGLARVDFFYEPGERGFLVNEVNTIPGFTPISMYPKLWQASGLGYAALIDELVALAQQRHARRRRNTER